MRNLLAIVPLIVLLAGCADLGAGTPQAVSTAAPLAVEAPTAAAPPAAAAEPDPSAAPAAAEQFAQVIAEYSGSWRGRADQACADNATADCRTSSKIAALNAQQALTELNQLGDPPAEIAQLLEETVPALRKLARVDVVERCAAARAPTSHLPSCRGAVADVSESIGPVTALLPGWEQHL
jgi:hypothetical protein